MSKMNKKWMYINDVNTSERQIITGYCLINNIAFETSRVDTDCFLISVYIDSYQEAQLNSFLSILYI